MKIIYWFFGALAFVFLAIIFIGSALPQKYASPPGSAAPSAACTDACALVTEPNAGTVPVIALIKSASQSVHLVMYQLTDKNIEGALAAAAKRGVDVRVILSSGYMGESSLINQVAYNLLRANKVAVHWSSDRFALTHEKSMVIDGVKAFIMSFNFVPKYYANDRDFGILDRDKNDVAAMEAVFDGDWKGSGSVAPAGDDLVWSPGARDALLELIDGAQHSLEVYNEEMADPKIIDALAEAVARGVTVRITMSYSGEWKSAFTKLVHAGAFVRTYPTYGSIYVHAKVIIADGACAFIGSQNFSPTSLELNRELGVLVKNTKIVSSIENTFEGDWNAAEIFN